MAPPATHQGPRAQRSAIGAKGEAWTRQVLDGLAAGDASTVVLHGLSAPGMGRGDIDHVVVRQAATGPVVLILDSKCWQPGLYWSLSGRASFRGRTRFRPAEHVVTRLAAQRLIQHLLACMPASKNDNLQASKTASMKVSLHARKNDGLQASRPASKQNREVGMLTPLVVIWPSRLGRISTIHLRLGDGTPWCRGHDLAAYLTRTLPPSSGEPIDPRLVAALASLRRSA